MPGSSFRCWSTRNPNRRRLADILKVPGSPHHRPVESNPTTRACRQPEASRVAPAPTRGKQLMRSVVGLDQRRRNTTTLRHVVTSTLGPGSNHLGVRSVGRTAGPTSTCGRSGTSCRDIHGDRRLEPCPFVGSQIDFIGTAVECKSQRRRPLGEFNAGKIGNVLLDNLLRHADDIIELPILRKAAI